MQVLGVLLLLVILALVTFRLYTHLAVHERRVVAAWDRLDTLLTQRNGLLDRACTATRDDPPLDLRALRQVVQEQERARRSGDLPGLAQGERTIRAEWDGIRIQLIDNDNIVSSSPDRLASRVAALDQAITDALGRYNAAVDTYAALRRQWAYGLLARLAGHTVFHPVRPPRP
ncbi:hypothetical protein [Thioalkalivibrio sp. ALMg11]|uniref:hypothetical protein n=1 Tax=Thioalkalivibrio sp. ALMg11 TaxID=1158165 RepID=UPI0003799EC2|nr:hypothetical protein [Thioalkalivibrio sp. ALMg11]